jgi:beta-ketoacyl-acyl-carrier-protein synthase II
VNNVRVVVTGLGVASPLGLSAQSTWEGMLAGRSGIGRIETFDTEGFECQIAAEIQAFEPTDYMDRKEARRMDRFSHLAVAAALEAVGQAGLKLEGTLAERTAVLIGSGVGGIMTLSQQYDVLHEQGPSRISPFLVPMMLVDMAGGQVSIMLGAKGPSYCTVTACATGSDSIGQGAEMIRRGVVDVAICGGAEAPVCAIAVAGFTACRALSRHNHDPQRASRPFDAERDGFVIGEGAGLLVIERLQHALDRGAEPLAELVGYGATSDASHITQPAPFGAGGSRAMRQALDQAGLRPEDVDYLNAHGTSTPLNDKFETQAIKGVFGDGVYKLPISSTKSMTGHLLGAAGAVEAAACVMAIRDGMMPPTINLEHPDEDCDLDYIPGVARQGSVNTVMSNALGFGGHNSSLVFQRYQP